jgi:hypothetical protein
MSLKSADFFALHKSLQLPLSKPTLCDFDRFCLKQRYSVEAQNFAS